MSIIIKTQKEIESLRKGGKILAETLYRLKNETRIGMTTQELDILARKYIKEKGGIPAFLNYTPEGISYPYPSALCVSLNDEIVHGIPKKDVFLKDGDVVSLDLGLKYENCFTDMAITFILGKPKSKKIQELLSITEEALLVGISEAQVGNRVGDIGYAIQSIIGRKFGIVRELSGHGVGRHIHEDPYIPNYGKKGTGELLREGMVIAIEPMINEGVEGAYPLSDEYTWVTEDGKMSAHFEKTILITKNGPEILTI